MKTTAEMKKSDKTVRRMSVQEAISLLKQTKREQFGCSEKEGFRRQLSDQTVLLSKRQLASSSVPLEAKPARKFSGTGLVLGHGLIKSTIIQSDASSKRSDNSFRVEEKEQTSETINKELEADLAEQANDVDANLVTSLDNCLNLERKKKRN